MNKQRTLSILKPDSVRQNKIGQIINIFECNKLNIIDMKMLRLSKKQASQFYQIHAEKPFFNDLVNFMASGPIVVLILEGEDAVLKNRELMGNTNPKLAKPGTIRYKFANSIDENAVHGSDSILTAKEEINFFFN